MTEEIWTLVRKHYFEGGRQMGWTEIVCENESIATFTCTGLDNHFGKEQRARAILAAAAPTMLDALKLYDATYCATQTHPTASQEAACMSVVRAAIALATTDQEEAESHEMFTKFAAVMTDALGDELPELNSGAPGA